MQERAVLSVTELTLEIKKQIETRFPSVHVQGEVINFKAQASGHLYFTLKDEKSQISAVLFRGNTQNLTRLPQNGDQVIVQGEISVYPPRGNYQLIIRQLQYAGVGELLVKLHALKTRLEGLGWFDRSRKKPLPVSPKTIGVVTSPTGAVIQDIIQVLSRRHAGFHLILNPVKVQGAGAAEEIAAAIDCFNLYNMADVLIVGRGGGSLEDLWPFNEEIVARAIYRSKIPIISAVGHETDFSIADFVADLRAPTPSAAAEIVMAASAERLERLSQIGKRLHQTAFHLVKTYQGKLEALRRQPILSSPFAICGAASQRLDDLSEELSLTIEREIGTKKLKLEGLKKQLRGFDPLVKIGHLQQKLTQLTAHLKAIDPKNLLKKGYSFLFRENTKSIIFSTQEIQPGDNIEVALQDGIIKAKTYEV